MTRFRFLGIRRAVAIGATSGALALAGYGAQLPMVAHAANTGACTFSGATTQLDPIPLTGANSGSFKFHGTASCVVNGALSNTTIDVADGHYDNIQCGTGTATGTAVFGGGFSPIGFSITFVGGQGTITATSGGTGGGVVNITASNLGGCVISAATGFNANGTFSGTQ